MARYDHKGVEQKWQKFWHDGATWQAAEKPGAKKSYVLDMFPYPSAAGLHVGHPEGYTATDIYCRYLRMKGVNVLHPMGWDAFGLPAENYAIKTGRHPKEVTWENIANFRRQIQSLGFSYDWSREVNTADPSYYKWTQWLFLKLYEKGLAYRKEAPANWCPNDQTVLANEQVVEGCCERCGAKVEQRNMQQWFFKTTAYADALLNDLEGLDWPVPIVEMQKNWIGKSEGAEVEFVLHFKKHSADNDRRGPDGKPAHLTVFTTRLDTIFGATYLVLAPEHPWVRLATDDNHDVLLNKEEVRAYIELTKKKSELQRAQLQKEKTGVELRGVKAVNPATKEEIPVWVADYVLGSYGTGAIMAVPAHDERDLEFAFAHNLPAKTVVVPKNANCVVVHGCPNYAEDNPDKSTYDKHWMKWLGRELSKLGIVGSFPVMPTPWEPNYEAWKKEFEKNKIDENSILIGHSCGCAFLARWLAETKEVVKHLIFVAPWKVADASMSQQKVDWYSHDIDKSIRFRAKYMTIFTSDDEELGGKQSAALFEEAWGIEPILLHKHGHYTLNDMGTEEFPELLSAILNTFVGSIEEGVLVQSADFNWLTSVEAKVRIAKKIGAELKTQYRLRDWLISRQRYWGAPIPIIYCDPPAGGCGEVPIPEKDLPVELPMDVDFRPTGESPLARSKSFHNVKCPKCGKPARRESDTMDAFVDSSWYYLRYVDPQNHSEPFGKKSANQWLPVNLYVGGAEHAVKHLMYARFITKVLQDFGYLSFSEPFTKLVNQGLILGEDGEKMSKSKGNVVNPDEIVEKFGADTLRMYEMFMGPLEEAKPWNTASIAGMWRFLDRVRRFAEGILEGDTSLVEPDADAERQVRHEEAHVISKVTSNIEQFKFNTAISAMMELFNVASNSLSVSKGSRRLSLRNLLLLLYPFAPHLTSELWERLKFGGNVWEHEWPTYDAKALKVETVTIAVQVNGKLRGTVEVSAGAGEAEVVVAARANPGVAKHLTSEPKKTVYVPGKLVSFVV